MLYVHYEVELKANIVCFSTSFDVVVLKKMAVSL